MKNELAITKHDLALTKLDLKKAKHDLEAKEEELKKEITVLRNPPFIHSCGYQRSTSVTVQTITYSTLLYSSTNTEGGGLDIETGIFTSPHPGSYTVTWALFSNSGHGDHDMYIYLYKNGMWIQESQHRSYYTGQSGYVDDQGKTYKDNN